jgi:hypothetical protein
MSTDAKRRASRINGALSHGPVTEAGKAIASKNAVRHGLLSRDVLLPSEEPAEYTTFCEGFHRDFQPVGTAERFCVEQMIDAAWRLRRIGVMESGLLRSQMFGERLPPVPVEPVTPMPRVPQKIHSLSVSAAAWTRFERDRRAFEQAVAKRDRAMRRAEQRRARRENDIGRAFGAVEATDDITKLQRHQTKLERTLRRFWQMLRELQAVRLREKRTAPVIDVESTGAAEAESRLDTPAEPLDSNPKFCETNPLAPMAAAEAEGRGDGLSALAGPPEVNDVFCETNPPGPAEADEHAQPDPIPN